MATIQNIPKLRFPGFEYAFEKIKFGRLYSFYTTNSLSRDKLNYTNGKVYNIHYGDIHTKFKSHFYLRNENIPFINEEVDLIRVKQELYCINGDIIIADASEDYSDIGKSIELIDIANEKVLAGLHTFLARPISDKTFIGFTSYLLKSWKLRKQIMTIAQGTKVLSLSTSRVSNLDLNIPSLPEQKKIASFLSAVDEKIQQLSRKKELLEQYKKGVMQQLFSGKLRFKDENGEDYADWEEKRLGECYNVKAGGDIDSKNSSKIKTEKFKYPIYANSEKAKGLYGYSDIFKIDYDCITVSGRGSLGIANARFEKFYPIVRLLILKPKKNIDVLFSEYALNLIEIYSESTGVPQLTAPQYSSYLISFPCLEEQKKIANFLSTIDVKIENTNQEMNQMQGFKKGLLQQMFV